MGQEKARNQYSSDGFAPGLIRASAPYLTRAAEVAQNTDSLPSLGEDMLLSYNGDKQREDTMAIRNVTRAGVGLVIGIIVLGLLVFGGLWLVRERGEQARRQEAINIADQQLKSDSDKGVALNDGDKDQKSGSDNSSQSQSGNTMPQTSTTPAETPSSATELPKTGPESGIFVGIGVLTFAVASFIRSRKLLASQL